MFGWLVFHREPAELPARDRPCPPSKIDRPGMELDQGGRFLLGCEFVRSKWLLNQPDHGF